MFDSAATFPKHKYRGQALPASQRNARGSVRINFTGLPAGTYVVSAVHDKDGNGKLTTNLLGIPTEPYGFTGQGSGWLGLPSFKNVTFNLPDEGAAITIATE